jgi:hypothetical protein
MSRWEELYDNHAIHETLEWLRESVSKEFDDVDESEISEKRRLLKIISKYEEVLSSLDTEIIPFNQLDSLNSALRHQSITSQINAYIQSGNVANLVEVNNLLTNQLMQLCLLYSLSGPSDVYKPIKDLEHLLDSATDTLSKKKDKLKGELSELESKSQAQDSRLADLDSLIEKKKTEVDSHITNWQKQFSNAQESRSQDYNKWRESFSSEKDEEIETLISKYNNQFENDSEEFRSSISELLKDGNEKHQSILELYEITAGDSVGAGYIKSADDEKSQADNWRHVSVGFIALTVAWMLFAYFSGTNNNYLPTQASIAHHAEVDANKVKPYNTNAKTVMSEVPNQSAASINWYKLFITFSLSGVLLWGSAYAAQQSTKHRNNEKKNRWFALEVKAFDPFISTLDEPQRNELKKQLAERIFGQSSDNANEDSKIIDEHALKVVTDTIVKILSKVPK